MEALTTLIPVRILLLGSLLAAAGLGNVASVAADTSPLEVSNTQGRSIRTEQVSVPISEPPAVDSVEPTTNRYVRNGSIGSITVHAENDDLVADVVWAVSRFDEIGLKLPAVEVFVSADQSECGDSAAYLTFVGEEQSMRIRACGTRITLLHELAHAWDVSALTDARRAAFMQLRGLDAWKADRWAEAAGEHAATVVAWGLNERPFGQDLRPNDVASMRDAFVLLTGRSPLWEPARDLSDHGTALDARTFVADPVESVRAPGTEATPDPDAHRPDFAPRLRQPVEAVRELSKPALTAVASANGRVGFLADEAAATFNLMKRDAQRDGVELSFASAWRSWKMQDRAHRHFLATGTNLAGNPVPNVADPDRSNHPRGLALDFVLQSGVHDWLSSNAHRFGWYPIESEAWHWEYRGAPEALLHRIDSADRVPLPADDALASRGSIA